MSITHTLFKNRRRGGLVLISALALFTLAASAFAKIWSGAPNVAAIATPIETCCAPLVPPVRAPEVGPQVQASSPDGRIHLAATVDRGAVLKGGDGLVRVELRLSADSETKKLPRQPTDMIVVLDRSGSMAGQKLEEARGALLNLLSQLSPEDRFALVTYESDAEVPISLAAATPSAKRSWQGVIRSINAGAGTNMSAGLDLATAMYSHGPTHGRVRRMLLLSDGHANEGDSTPEALSARAARAIAGEYVVSTVGVGAGFNETLMSQLADRGTGNYYYLDGEAGLSEIVAQELQSAQQTVASSVVVRFDSGAGVQLEDAAGYPIEQLDGVRQFRVGTLRAGQKRQVWLTLRTQPSAEKLSLGSFHVDYTRDGVPAQLALVSLPELKVVSARQAFLAALNQTAWGSGVAMDDFNRMRTQVAGLVQRGEQARAKQTLSAWRSRYSAMNAELATPEASVSAAVDQAEQLEAEVDEAFSGPSASSKRNLWSKSSQASSIKQRRNGSY